MKKNSNPKILKVDILGLLWQWLKGAWGSFSRFVKRSLNPSRGRRGNSTQDSEPAHTNPLVGISHFRNAESLTVKDLMAQVKWRVPEQAAKSSSVSSIKDQINWD